MKNDINNNANLYTATFPQDFSKVIFQQGRAMAPWPPLELPMALDH